MASFANFCNICYKIDNESLKDISEENVKHFKDILITFLGHADIIKHNKIYLCQLCREQLTCFDSFRKMCLSNLIEMRQMYINMKMGIEDNDTNIDNESDASQIEVMKKEHDFKNEKQNSDSELNVKQENNISEYLDRETNEDAFAFQIANVCTIVNIEHCKPLNNSSENAKPGMKLRNRSTLTAAAGAQLNRLHVRGYHNRRSSKSLQSHARNLVHPDVEAHTCTVCNESFRTRRSLIGHARTHYDGSTYKCTACNKTFTQLSHLIRHERIHNGARPYKCSVCNKTFARSDYLTKHERVHSGARPYKCTVCNQTFTQLAHLTTHNRVHSATRPYKCTSCNKTFTRLIYLTRHEGIHSDARSYECTVCNKTFKQLAYLTRHKRMHSDARPYKCTVCNKTFTQLSHLTTHESIHSDARPYKCNVCNKTFTQLAYLTRHKRIHSDARSYKCTVCNKTFTQLAYLTRHKRIHNDARP